MDTSTITRKGITYTLCMTVGCRFMHRRGHRGGVGPPGGARMTPTQAGWTDTLAPETGPQFCDGSGQTAIFAPFGAAVPCPVCGRLVRIAPHLPGEPVSIADHQPPAVVAPTMSLGL